MGEMSNELAVNLPLSWEIALSNDVDKLTSDLGSGELALVFFLTSNVSPDDESAGLLSMFFINFWSSATSLCKFATSSSRRRT